MGVADADLLLRLDGFPTAASTYPYCASIDTSTHFWYTVYGTPLGERQVISILAEEKIMSDYAHTYNLAVCRQLLLAAFTPDELRRLCRDNSATRPILDLFSPNDGLDNMVEKVLDYCERHLLWDEFLAAVEQNNPRQYARFKSRLQDTGSIVDNSQTPPASITFAVQVGDVTDFNADILALKFAQSLYGADKAVTYALGKTEIDLRRLLPAVGTYKLLPTAGKIQVKQVLFVSVPDLYDFEYAEIRQFAAQVLEIVAKAASSTQHLAMTIHGVGYGLDEAEALRSQLAGYLDAFDSGKYPTALEQITIVERSPDRARRLRDVLTKAIPNNVVVLPKARKPLAQPPAIQRSPLTTGVGRDSAAKPHIFVAMPFADELADVFHYGIQAPVNSAGYLCERIDLTAFTGDILDRIKSRIQTADLVIAEVTTLNPNVFLEVGYAWGRERPTVLLTTEPDKLPFDIRGQRCLVYKRIQDLEQALAKELQGLKNTA